MKVINCNKNWGASVNFVDEKERLVGFDMSQCCCETFWWAVSKSPTPDFEEEPPTQLDADGYEFDPLYKEEASSTYDEFAAVFRLVKEGEPDLYLHLINCHNGYYAHGFEWDMQGEGIGQGEGQL